MSYYSGEPIPHGPVELSSPARADYTAARESADVELSDWYERAAADETLLYFAVTLVADGTSIGEVMLHDIDRESAEAHLHVHIFRAESRDLGHGEHALRAAIEYAFRQQKLRELSLSVNDANFAARRCYAKCGFQVVDRLEEDESQLVMRLTRDEWKRMEEEGWEA
jgi:RimJ/RimL family protein N-acetyltransferase